jgi:hypothetical protein
MVLESGDDKQLGDQCHYIHRRCRRLFQMDYFFADSAVFASTLAAGVSLLTGVASAFLASTLQVLSLTGSHLAGAAGVAGAVTAVVATGAAAGVAVLAGSVAKAAVASKVAIRVAIVFI